MGIIKMADILNKVADKANDAAEGLLGGKFTVGVSAPLLGTFALWVILGVVLGWFLTDNRMVYAAFVLTGWSFCVLVHEMGHAAFASWSGDGSVKDYTNGNFIAWGTIVNNYIAPVCATFVFGLGIHGGITWLDEARMFLAGDTKRIITAFGGIIFSLSFSLILAIPLWILSDHVTWVYCGIAVLIYFNAIATILNLIPFPPMDIFNVIFPLLPNSAQAFVTQWTANKWYSLGLLLIVILIAWALGDLVGSLAWGICDLLFLKDEAAVGLGRFYVLLGR